MLFVIDANIFAGFFRVCSGVPGEPLTGDPCGLFDLENTAATIAFDAGNHVESEWTRVVPAEWATAWIGDALIKGKIRHFHAVVDPSLVALLRRFGFPLRGSGDLWYLRLADSSSVKGEGCLVVTEDLDFFDPRQKGTITGAARLKFLREHRGPLRRALEKQRKICVRCVHGVI